MLKKQGVLLYRYQRSGFRSGHKDAVVRFAYAKVWKSFIVFSYRFLHCTRLH